MKILIDSYNNVMQHAGGGVQMRIGKFLHYFGEMPNVEAKLFDKWYDKLDDYDILHEFKVTTEPYALISFAKSLGKKVVISSVVAQEHALRIKFALAANKLLPVNNSYSFLKMNMNHTDAIIAQTQKEAKFISNNYGINPNKIHVIPNGVNESILDVYSPQNHKDIILCVGRFDHNKNQLSLIKAMQGTRYELHFIGGKAIDDASYYYKCLEAAKHMPNIKFHGWLSNTSEEYLELYRRAKVVALVSHKEIFGNSLVEGAACGANLLSTNVLPTHEWGFNEHCVKVNVDNIAELHEGIVKAFEMQTDSSLHDIVCERFSWENIAKQHVSLYEHLLK